MIIVNVNHSFYLVVYFDLFYVCLYVYMLLWNNITRFLGTLIRESLLFWNQFCQGWLDRSSVSKWTGQGNWHFTYHYHLLYRETKVRPWLCTHRQEKKKKRCKGIVDTCKLLTTLSSWRNCPKIKITERILRDIITEEGRPVATLTLPAS